RGRRRRPGPRLGVRGGQPDRERGPGVPRGPRDRRPGARARAGRGRVAGSRLARAMAAARMTDVRRAEVAGAGLAGLTVAAVLAQRGWKVRVHEQAGELREIGAGIYLFENALR